MTDQTEELRNKLTLAAVNCGHTIEYDHITLHRDKKKPGNALSQLLDRLLSAIDAEEVREESAPDERETEAWLIEWDDTHGHRKKVHRHNAVADYRAIYEGVTVTELVKRTVAAQPTLGPLQAIKDAALKLAIQTVKDRAVTDEIFVDNAVEAIQSIINAPDQPAQHAPESLQLAYDEILIKRLSDDLFKISVLYDGKEIVEMSPRQLLHSDMLSVTGIRGAVDVTLT